MYKTIFKTIIRNFYKSKGLFLLKILSFTIVLSFSVFVLGWINFENNFDKWIQDNERVFRLTVQYSSESRKDEFAFIWREWLKEVPEYFPEIEEMVRLEHAQGNAAIRAHENLFNTNNLYGADSNVFKIFDVELLHGTPSGILDDPKSAVISESMALKCFGTTDCLNKPIQIMQTWDTSYHDFTIKGVIKDFPDQSHFHPEILASFDDPSNYNRRSYVYLKLHEQVNPTNLVERFEEFQKKHAKEDPRGELQARLQPITDIHLYSNKDRELEPLGNPKVLNVLIYSILVLLFICLANYINLQITHYSKSRKLLSVNKTLGATKSIKLTYITFGSVLMLLISLIITIISFYSILHLLNLYLGIKLYISFADFLVFLAVTFLSISSLVLLSDLYIVYNSEKWMGSSRSNMLGQEHALRKSKTRSMLLVVQSSISIVIIIASIVTIRQLNFMNLNRLGNGESNIVNLKNLPRSAVDNYGSFKEELLKHPSVVDVTSSMEEPSGQTNDRFSYIIDGKEEPDKRLFVLPVDYNFNTFYGNELIAGEDLSKVNNLRSSTKYVVNETAMKYLGFHHPNEIVGKRFEYNFPYQDFFFPGYISGVVKDFHLSTMEEKAKPMVLYYLSYFNYCFSIKFQPNTTIEGIQAVEQTWKKLFPNNPFEYHFIDELYDQLYKQYIMQSKFLNLVLFMILLISNIGLLSVIALQVERRTKEIGIRKVNGAKVSEVLTMLNKDFVKWVIIAFVIASPIAWFSMNKWLENFAYKTELSLWIFALAGLIALGIALFTVSFQSWKASSRNPIESLRYE